jgi:hypothetical protein
VSESDALSHALFDENPVEYDLAPFSRFFGAWDVEVRDLRPGRPEVMRGVWTFGPALQARAVLDVWNVPGYECGLSVRFYDPALGAWRSTWHGPAHGMVATFVATEREGEIVLQAIGSGATDMQWIFSEMAPSSFRWRFVEDGAVVQRMVARRLRLVD